MERRYRVTVWANEALTLCLDPDLSPVALRLQHGVWGTFGEEVINEYIERTDLSGEWMQAQRQQIERCKWHLSELGHLNPYMCSSSNRTNSGTHRCSKSLSIYESVVAENGNSLVSQIPGLAFCSWCLLPWLSIAVVSLIKLINSSYFNKYSAV